MRNKIVPLSMSAMLAAGMILSGCSKDEAKQPPSTSKSSATLDQTPVDLMMASIGSTLTDEEFKTLIADPVKAKYPFINVTMYRYQPGENIDSLLTAGKIPDIIYSGILDVPVMKKNALEYDMRPLIEKWGVNLSDFEQFSMDMIRKYDDKGAIYSLPFSMLFPVMYYNKDIFDRFAVPYPKDNMTWAETIEIARKLSQSVDGVKYKGLGTIAAPRLSLTMLQEKFDPKSGKVVLTNDSWKEFMDIYYKVRSIPGNDGNITAKDFTTNKSVAMFAAFNGEIANMEQAAKNGDNFNWDIVTFPSMPNRIGMVDTPMQMMSVTSQSKFKDQAFQVLKVAASKENQLKIASGARPPILKDPEVKAAFGKDYATLKGKNTQVFTKYKYQPINVGSLYDDIVNKEIGNAATAVVDGKKDINTALREAEEAANKGIDALKK